MPLFPSSPQFLAPSPGDPNDALKRERQALGLKDPVYIRFEKVWEAGNPLFDWYSQHSDRTIIRMQRHKERCSPSFHEYIVIQLDNGEYYRIDRRPDERAHSMGYTSGKAVPASDTFEPTPSFEQSLHCPEGSDLMLDLQFNVTVQLQLILHILYAIHSHPEAKFYTLQNHNCYFLARAIAFCTIRSVKQRYGKHTRDIEFPFSDEYWKAVTPDPEVVDPANEKFPPIKVENRMTPILSLRKRLFKQAAVQGKNLMKRINEREDSDLSAIWDLKQFDNKALGPSLDVQKVVTLKGQAQKSAQALARAWSYSGRISQMKSLFKGSPYRVPR